MSSLPVATKPLTRVSALALTNQIRKAVDRTWELLLAAYEGQAHLALGYERWEDYIAGEFDMTRGNAYRLVNQGVVTVALQEATGTPVTVSAREAGVLKRDLPAVTKEVVTAVERGAQPAEAVRAAVQKRSPPKRLPPVPQPDPEAAAIEAEEAARRSQVIPVDAIPVIERGDVLYVIDAMEALDPRAAARKVTERDVMRVKRWVGALVAARQEMAPLTTARKEQIEREKTGP